MSTSPPPTVSRGDLTLQPPYFTSSLFVNPLREDISHLIHSYAERYLSSDLRQPFALFKAIWAEQGWSWFHLKVFDARARDKFVSVTLRLFAEYFVDDLNPFAAVIALFGLYTFYSTQPSTSGPSLHSVKHIPLPMNHYRNLLALPSNLTEPHLLPLQPYATHLLSTLLDSRVFHILPNSSLRPQNPSDVPREIFVGDESDSVTMAAQSTSETTTPDPGTAQPKKKGRPSKREKTKKANEALVSLERWLDKNTYTYQASSDDADAAAVTSNGTAPRATHTLITHPPSASRAIYSMQKNELLDALDPSTRSVFTLEHTEGATAVPVIDPALMERTVSNPEKEVLACANETVLTRLRKIDEMAAAQGLEVGGEGGEMTGLMRVEKAVREFKEGKSRGGILNLLDGAGTNAAMEGPGGCSVAGAVHQTLVASPDIINTVAGDIGASSSTTSTL